MFLGAPARSLDDIARLRRTGFDFGEIAIANAGARRMWWESGVMNGGLGKFFLMAHGPLEGNPNDSGYLWNRYIPSLMATVDTLNRMSIAFAKNNVRLNRRFFSRLGKEYALPKVCHVTRTCLMLRIARWQSWIPLRGPLSLSGVTFG